MESAKQLNQDDIECIFSNNQVAFETLVGKKM